MFSVLAEGESQQVALCLPVLLQTINQEQATQTSHRDASPVCGLLHRSLAVSPGLSGLDITDAGVHLAQSGRATPTSSISANSHSSTW